MPTTSTRDYQDLQGFDVEINITKKTADSYVTAEDVAEYQRQRILDDTRAGNLLESYQALNRIDRERETRRQQYAGREVRDVAITAPFHKLMWNGEFPEDRPCQKRLGQRALTLETFGQMNPLMVEARMGDRYAILPESALDYAAMMHLVEQAKWSCSLQVKCIVKDSRRVATEVQRWQIILNRKNDNSGRLIGTGYCSELQKSIVATGLMNPLLVRPFSKGERGQRYEIVDGHCRFQAIRTAMRMGQLPRDFKISVTVTPMDTEQEVATYRASSSPGYQHLLGGYSTAKAKALADLDMPTSEAEARARALDRRDAMKSAMFAMHYGASRQQGKSLQQKVLEAYRDAELMAAVKTMPPIYMTKLADGKVALDMETAVFTNENINGPVLFDFQRELIAKALKAPKFYMDQNVGKASSWAVNGFRQFVTPQGHVGYHIQHGPNMIPVYRLQDEYSYSLDAQVLDLLKEKAAKYQEFISPWVGQPWKPQTKTTYFDLGATW